MFEVIFLLSLATVWLIFASIQDLRYREVANWLNFSLIIFALGFRFFYSLFIENFAFFYQGLIGLAIFFAIGNLLYYGRMFAGGDAKLMIALGVILPISDSLAVNAQIFVSFFFFFLFIGGIYGLGWSFYLPLKNIKSYKKHFRIIFAKSKRINISVMLLGMAIMVSGFYNSIFFFLGLFIFFLPYFYLHAKTVDESCLIKKVNSKNLVEGDWLYADLKVGKKIFKANWHGLTHKQIKEIQKKHKSINVRQGIPFVPVFLISFLALFYVYFFNYEIIEFLLRGFFLGAIPFL